MQHENLDIISLLDFFFEYIKNRLIPEKTSNSIINFNIWVFEDIYFLLQSAYVKTGLELESALLSLLLDI